MKRNQHSLVTILACLGLFAAQIGFDAGRPVSRIVDTYHNAAPRDSLFPPGKAGVQQFALSTTNPASSVDVAVNPAGHSTAIILSAAGFTPAVLTVESGTEVTWYNATSQSHILKSGEPYRIYLPLILRNAPGLSNRMRTTGTPGGLITLSTGEVFSGTLAPGGTFTHTFANPGEFPYFAATAPNWRGRVIVQAATALPPDPGSVAPPVDPSVATDIYSSTSFLYTGRNPIQTGVAPGTIEITRAAVLRGRVLNSDGTPIAGTQVTVLNHPEFGQTLSRLDGMFDLAVNGGGWLTFNYQKSGYLPVQRKLDVPWRNFTWLPDVVMLPADPNVTAVDLSSSAMQVVQGSVISDTDGIRQATLLVPPDTQATLIFSGGVTQTLSAFHVRITEYTVGERGPQAMPGELPPQSAYTYADEYTVDEAVAAGALNVSFSQPLIHYSHNFLGFPVGMAVPTGYYDRVRGLWVASENGRVVEVITVTSGLADLDTDGDGLADNGVVITPTMVLTITTAERQRLAELYTPGQELWRVPIRHFSPWDCNWPYSPPDDADAPDVPAPTTPNAEPDNTHDCNDQGSVINCQKQSLGEDVALVGTPYRLHYSSDRAPLQQGYVITIPLSGDTLPASLKRIELEVLVAGQEFQQGFATAPNQSTAFTWDGKDAYGRTLYGRQQATVRVGYAYDGVYRTPSQMATAFASFGYNVTGVQARQEVIIWTEWQVNIGGWNAQSAGLGGWGLDVHHVYDPNDQVLYLGNGRQRSAQTIGAVISTLVGNYTWGYGYGGDGGPADQARINGPFGVAAGPDGSIYIADSGNHRIRRIGPDGIITTVAGNGNAGYSGDGGPATQAGLNRPRDVAIGPDGSLYIADTSNARVRRVGPNGIITTVAGNGIKGFSGDGGPATNAWLDGPYSVAVGPDGSLYIADLNNSRIRRIGPDGIITTVAGNGSGSYSGDGGPATEAALAWPRDISVGPDGSLYIADTINSRIRRVGPSGTITTVAGNGYRGYNCTGCPATEAWLDQPQGVEAGPDGSFYIADGWNQRVRWVGPDGMIVTVAGNGNWEFDGDGGPALQAGLTAQAVALKADGSLVISDKDNNRIRRMAPALPQVGVGNVLIPAEDGRQVYVFSTEGRHLRTLDALTNAILNQFTYDSAGRLTSVTDGDGNTTTIERDANGKPTAIAGPYGQRTTLAVDANGNLSSIANPAGESVALTYVAGGLLATLRDSRGNTHHFTYDALGRLIRDADPAGGYKTLARDQANQVYTVTLTTALSRTTTYRVEALPQGGQQRTNTFPDGTATDWLQGPGGQETTRYADGTTTALTPGPDPRWGMQAPLAARDVVSTPASLVMSVLVTSAVQLAEVKDPLSLVALTNTTFVNGRPYTTTYAASSRTITMTTPAGRPKVAVLDAQGRVVQEQSAGLDPIRYRYDPQGRLISVTVGLSAEARTLGLHYGSAGFLDTLTDPLGRSVSLGHDAVGRVVTQTLPDGQVIAMGYNANGNLTSITPPGRPAHTFAYSPVNLVTEYTPPVVSGVGNLKTQYTYNADRELIRVTRPDNQTVDLSYDSAGRLSTLTSPRGVARYLYNPSCGCLMTVTAPGGITLTYDYDGALLTGQNWAGAINGSVAYGHDNNLWVISQSVNGGVPLSFAYDPDGLLVQAGDLSLSRDMRSGLITGTLLGIVTDTRSYNGFGEPSSYRADSGGSTLFARQYGRDKLGRITLITETVSGTTTLYGYSYDLGGRLVTVAQNGGTVAQYTYDSNGNRLSFTGPGGTVNASYDNQDRLLQYGTTTYTYTANGELLSKIVSGQTTAYVYDPLGNLMQVALPGGAQIEYLVDGQNRRIGRKVNSVLMQGFLYQDQLKPVAELDGAGSIVSRFIYATHVNVPDYMIKGGVTYRIIADHLDSPRLVMDVATGVVAQRMDYDEFGRVLTDTNPGFQPFGFAGGLYDHDTRLVRYGLRDYDPETGRWTAKDPLGFVGGATRLYEYANGDPVNWIDPLGLRCHNFWDEVLERRRITYESLLGEILSRARNFLTSGIVASELGLLTWPTAVRLLIEYGFSSEVVVSAGLGSLTNAFYMGLAWEVGVDIGSFIGALIDYLIDLISRDRVPHAPGGCRCSGGS